MPDISFKQNTVVCAPGDTLVCYTDGVTEAMNADGEEFGLERLREIFQNNLFGDSHELTQAILDAVSAFAGETAQSDDITCLALRHIGGGS
jgi:sigma-B regulation protein RsbU (phosphoserine phosphatase)